MAVRLDTSGTLYHVVVWEIRHINIIAKKILECHL